MERENDVQLVRSILSGDDAAFSTLVEKYQKSVHALVWRKIGDFHYAEEITQDTFLQAYKKLATLKNPNQFAGWLYVIANRLCLNWMRKKKLATQSLESTHVGEVEKSSYTRYVAEQRETAASERRGETVKRLLARLPESERTVVTLYYLGEMTSKEIGKFLGVSVKTVHSRLHRARKRLQEKDELLVSEVLGGVQLPTNLTENITRQVANMKPVPPSVAKPLLPWAAFGTATVLIILLLGASSQYLARFQQPYSFEAQAEPTVELVDAFFTVEIDANPAVQNQAGQVAYPGRSVRPSPQSTETTLTSNRQENFSESPASQWTQTNGPYGGTVFNIFVAPERTLYAATSSGIYRREVDAPAWTLINTEVRSDRLQMPMAAHGETLYVVSADNIVTSIDNGETWQVFCARPKGFPIEFVIMDETDGDPSRSGIVMYLALQGEGVFRSTDAGVQWDLLAAGLAGESITAVAAISNKVFAGTSNGIYRLDSGIWRHLPTSPSEPVYWMTGFENSLYVGTGPDLSHWGWIELSQKPTTDPAFDSNAVRSGGIFHSTDFGASWTQITLENGSDLVNPEIGISVSAGTGEIRLPQGIVAMDKRTFYRAGPSGIHRTTDGGQSWHLFTNGIRETAIEYLVAVNNSIYGYTRGNLVRSVDGGETWETVQIDFSTQIREAIKQQFSHLNIDTNTQGREAIEQQFSHLNLASPLAVANGTLYGIVPEYKAAPEKDALRLFRLTVEDGLVPVQGAPAFERESSSVNLLTGDDLANTPEKRDNSPNPPFVTAKYHNIGAFAVSGQTFYVQWKRHLFKWKPGDSEWTDTGLIDNSEHLHGFDSGFKLAVSGDTVYVGKRDGKLFQSLDAGKSWKNITPTLPLHFTRFKQIVFAGTTVYVATDEGVLRSETGAHWQVLTDGMGAPTVINNFAMHHTRVYGADAAGIYRLDTRGKWEQIFPSIPDTIVSLVVSEDRLYIATQRRGVFHIPLDARL